MAPHPPPQEMAPPHLHADLTSKSLNVLLKKLRGLGWLYLQNLVEIQAEGKLIAMPPTDMQTAKLQ